MTLVMGCNQERALAVRDMNAGIDAYERGATPDAIRLLREAAQADPTYPEPRYFLAQIYHVRLKDFDRAESYYREALALSPNNAQFAYRLGAVLAEQGKHEDATRNLERALEHKPDYSQAWFRLGLSQQALGKYTEAVDSYMKSIQANPRLRMERSDPGGEAYHALGDLYIRFGLYDNALKVYENGVANNAASARLYHGRGVAQLQLERYEDAASSFEKTLEVDGQHASATFNLAMARQALGQDQAAVDVLESFLQSGGSDPARAMAARQLLQQLGDKLSKNSAP